MNRIERARRRLGCLKMFKAVLETHRLTANCGQLQPHTRIILKDLSKADRDLLKLKAQEFISF